LLYPDDPGPDRAAVVSMSAGNSTWRVVFAQPYEAFLAPVQAQLRISLLVAVLTGSLVTIIALLIAQYLARPIVHLTSTAIRIADGDLEVQAQVESGNEIGSLAVAFNRMTEQVRQMMQGLVQKNSQLEQEMLERERAETARLQSEAEREKLLLAQAELQAKLIEVQRQTLKELSTPIIPIMDRIIVLPLIGTVDNTRAKDLTRAVLNGVSHYRAKVIILDITGVSSIDSDVADHLNKTIQAARLKGARTIVTGISDSVAETIVDLGIDWSKIETLRDLQSGLMAALQSVGIRVLRKDGKK
jgi:anti-anti-sigma regulatory factor/HAMP domain-containing protein